ncbi:MAG: hypothetical protein COB69_05180 [Phycisphaera sp.]|nr:MAG: hypothetical protein COB69_05180 [Phycisphaera sp.]
MKPIARTFAAAAGVAFLAACAAALGAGVATHRAAPTSIALVDIDRISAEMEEFKVPSETFQAKVNTRLEDLRSIQTRMTSLSAELDLIPATDQDARIAKNTQIIVLDSEFKTKQQIYESASGLDQAQLFKKMFDRIEAGAAKLAARDGIDIMLVDDRVFMLSETNFAAQNSALESKKILFAGEAVDLTDELLTMLNNDFNAGK